MSVTKGIFALLVVTGVFVALLNQIVPKSENTPVEVMDKAMNASQAKTWRARDAQIIGRDVQINLSNEVKLRADSNVTAASAIGQGGGSELVTLITGKGLACARVTGVQPVHAGDGIYAITCAVGAGSQRYIVDTRQGTASAA
jgi:hypothetical protein